MGRPKKAPPNHFEPEFDPQGSTEGGPAAVLDGAAGKSINQAELVRKAVAAGHEKPAYGVAYIKSQFGVDVDSKYYSVAKTQLKKREEKAAVHGPAKRGPKPKGPTPLVEGYVAPPEKPRSPGDPDVLMALQGVKELVGQFGAERVKKMVDLLS